MIAVVVTIMLELSITRVAVVVTMMVDTSMISTDDVITDVIMLSVILGKVLLTDNGSDEVIMTALVGVDTMLVIASVNVNASTEVIMELISALVISIADITAVGKLGMTVTLVVLPAISLFISIVLVDDEILSDIVSFIMSTGDILMVMLSFCDAVSN